MIYKKLYQTAQVVGRGVSSLSINESVHEKNKQNELFILVKTGISMDIFRVRSHPILCTCLSNFKADS